MPGLLNSRSTWQATGNYPTESMIAKPLEQNPNAWMLSTIKYGMGSIYAGTLCLVKWPSVIHAHARPSFALGTQGARTLYATSDSVLIVC